MFTTPPFRRAPWLLFRRRVLLVAILGTAMILGLVASLTPLFGSSAGSEALQRQLEGRCASRFAAKMPVVTSVDADLARDLELNEAVLQSTLAADDSFEQPNLVLRGGTADLALAGGDDTTTEVRLFGLDDFRDHIELVEGAHGAGAYIDRRTSDWIGAGPGDEVVFTYELFDFGGHSEITTVLLTVTAVYEDVYHQYLDPYWCTFQQEIAPSAMGDLPPAPLLLDSRLFQDDTELFHSIYGGGHEPGQWHVPIRIEGLTVTDAYRAAETIEETNVDIERRLGEALGQDLTEYELALDSELLPVTDRVRSQIEALQTSIFPLAAVVLLASVGLLGAAGSYWVERRRSELELLSTVGVPPVGIAVKAGLELLLPVVAGALLGAGVGNLVIGLVGPSPDIEILARRDGLLVTIAAAGVGLLAAALVAGVKARGLLDRRGRRSSDLSLRWPLIVLSLVAAFMVRTLIGDQAVTLGESVVVGSVDPMVLFFPVLVLLAAVLLISELVTLARPLIYRLGRASHSGFLASRRVLSAPAVALALIAGAAVPVAILVYSANLARSATISIDAKGKTSIGSDVSTLIYRIEDLPPAMEGNSTIVIKLERARLDGLTVDVIGVDPATFADGGFWLSTYADRSLIQVLDDLAGDSDGAVLDAVVANGAVSGGVVDNDAMDFEVEVVGSVSAFPGSVRDRPLLVVDRSRLQALLAPDEDRIRGADYMIWSKGLEEAEIDGILADSEMGFAFTVAADTTLDQLKFAVIVWTFEFLRLYAALAGLIVIASVLIYTDTRQRARNLSYALARRMGLSRKDHALAGLLEVGSLTMLGALAGVAVGRWASRDLYLALDPLPETPPAPQWVGTADITLVVLALVVLLAAASARMAQRTADNADVSELLRHGG
ncbi:MAG TPA: FtsX-like permease family protein [Acidimicrobiia bacterium]|nr:FtsX-like permease family protein [Acidimicrobiia bacterium]